VKVEPPEGKANRGLKFTYAEGVELYHSGPSGCTFVGSNGFIYVDRDIILSRPEGILKGKQRGQRELLEEKTEKTRRKKGQRELFHNGRRKNTLSSGAAASNSRLPPDSTGCGRSPE